MTRHLTLLFIIGIGLIATASAQPSCPPGQSSLRLELNPDFYWYEVSWIIMDVQTGAVLYNEALTEPAAVIKEYCVPANKCIEFRILDSSFDGISPTGSYSIFLNDTLVFENPTGQYYGYESTTLGCPPGAGCNNAINIITGQYATVTGLSETWYRFTPPQNGTYELSTCDTNGVCPTKIWVYGVDCQYITPGESNAGTLFYSNSGCGNNDSLAVATLFLQGGNTYYVRVGYANDHICNNHPINFDLTYIGAITGCTDTLACNYNPLASISGDCIYPGDPNCPNGPDLATDEQLLRSSFILESYANGDQCAVEEGCINGFGMRNIIRFDTKIANIGEADYYIGTVPSSPTVPSQQFVYDPCHQHWHYRGYAEYVLYDAEGNLLPVGSKNGFCVLDFDCDQGYSAKYGCENMGISVGCSDTYESYLECQWIDITDLPAGQYTFVMRVNWDKTPDRLGRLEKTYENNWAQVCFQLTYSANGAPNVEQIDPCVAYVDCAGVPYGGSKLDCEAVCDGTALFGDLNVNQQRDDADVQIYLQTALQDTATVTNCRDLFADGHTDVYDAALLQECVLHGDSVAYWGTRYACSFPTGKENPNDLVYFRIVNSDTLAKTVDIRMNNPFNKVLAYELDLSGIKIDSVKNLAPEFEAVIRHTNTRIIALSTNEKPLDKHSIPTDILRVYYTDISATEVCVDSVITAVSDKYIRSNVKVGSPACASLMTSSSNEAPVVGDFPINLVPNPALEQVSVFFPNTTLLPTDITVTDMQGRVVRSFLSVRTNSVTITRNALPSGLYLVQLRNGNGSAVAKLIWQ